MARWFSVAAVVIWVTAMAALVYRDVLPHWIAGAPPAQMPNTTAEGPYLRYQSGIFTSSGRVGTSWVIFDTAGGNTLVHTLTALDGLPLMPPLLVDSKLTYTGTERLDSIDLKIHGAPIRLEFRGEDYGMDFSCELITGNGPQDKFGFKLDTAAAATMNEALRPFTLLKDLHVGKTWRMRLINPLPAIRGGKAELEAYLVRVTGKETIEHNGSRVECFRVESHNVRAWAAPDGQVLVQEVDLPIFGTISIRQETYDEPARQAASLRQVPGLDGDPPRQTTTAPLMHSYRDRPFRRFYNRSSTEDTPSRALLQHDRRPTATAPVRQ
jgi:hypothetical protein